MLYAIVDCQQDLPEKKLLESFETKFPKALYTTWQSKNRIIWEATFLWEKKERTAFFNENGEWIETHIYLPLGTVPLVVRKNFNIDYPSNSAYRIFLLEKPEGNFYEFQVNKENENHRIIYNARGEMA